MWYGMQDLGRNLLGLRPSRDYRLQTTDHRHKDEAGGVQGADLPQSVVRSPLSVVSPPTSAVYSPPLPPTGLGQDEFRAVKAEPSGWRRWRLPCRMSQLSLCGRYGTLN
jgi:hypothetical protein